MGEGARRAGEGKPAAGKGATKQRLLITAIATLLGAGVGLLLFGPSPAILLGVLVGFLTGQTIHGLVFPASADDGTAGTQAIPGPPGHTTGDATRTPAEPPAVVPGRDWSLALVLGAWGLIILFVGGLAQLGLLGGEGASLVLIFVLPVLALLGLMGGSTASAMARRTLRQIEAGQRPEADRGPAQLALTLSRLTTVALVAFLGWLLLRVNV